MEITMNGKPEHIGFIGVGLMGHKIAQNILADLRTSFKVLKWRVFCH